MSGGLPRPQGHPYRIRNIYSWRHGKQVRLSSTVAISLAVAFGTGIQPIASFSSLGPSLQTEFVTFRFSGGPSGQCGP